MIFNLKKAQIPQGVGLGTVSPISGEPNMDWTFAVKEVLAVARKPNGEPYFNIQEYMADNGVSPTDILEQAAGTNENSLEESAVDVGKLEEMADTIKMQSSDKEIKPFNLKKAQFGWQEEPYGSGDKMTGLEGVQEQQGVEKEIEQSKAFEDHSKLKDFLTQKMREDPRNAFKNIWRVVLLENPQQPDQAQEKIKLFIEEPLNIKSEEGLLHEAHEIYKDIYGEENTITMELERKSLNDNIADINNEIIKIAKKIKKKEIKTFNLKTAQHKTQENVIMYGPQETRKVDPFSRQPVSDWHIIERNKGFGLVVDDVWNIDYETIWRENIMDKYSRPYKDKDGNWVGGYIQKRFEVDKNIPEQNNMQLKPGQKRRPILPQYGNLETRLQDARSKGNVAGANNIAKPFNWKEASSKKKDN